MDPLKAPWSVHWHSDIGRAYVVLVKPDRGTASLIWCRSELQQILLVDHFYRKVGGVAGSVDVRGLSLFLDAQAAGIFYEDWLAGPDGAAFCLYPRSEQVGQVAVAKSYLRNTRDVVRCSSVVCEYLDGDVVTQSEGIPAIMRSSPEGFSSAGQSPAKGKLNGARDSRLVTKGGLVEFQPSCSRIAYTIHLPAGLPVRWLPDPSGGRWVLDAFPVRLFPENSILRHDAEHYGVSLLADQLSPAAVEETARRLRQQLIDDIQQCPADQVVEFGRRWYGPPTDDSEGAV